MKTFTSTKVLLYEDWLVIAKAADWARGQGVEAKDLTEDIIRQIDEGAKEYDKRLKCNAEPDRASEHAAC